MTEGAWLYILRCADGAYYTGTARTALERRIAEHNAGTYDGWTSKRRPVQLVYSQHFLQITDAIATERQIKGWSRRKKDALIAQDFERLKLLAKRSADALMVRDAAYAAPHHEEPHPEEAEGRLEG